MSFSIMASVAMHGLLLPTCFSSYAFWLLCLLVFMPFQSSYIYPFMPFGYYAFLLSSQASPIPPFILCLLMTIHFLYIFIIRYASLLVYLFIIILLFYYILYYIFPFLRLFFLIYLLSILVHFFFFLYNTSLYLHLSFDAFLFYYIFPLLYFCFIIFSSITPLFHNASLL